MYVHTDAYDRGLQYKKSISYTKLRELAARPHVINFHWFQLDFIRWHSLNSQLAITSWMILSKEGKSLPKTLRMNRIYRKCGDNAPIAPTCSSLQNHVYVFWLIEFANCLRIQLPSPRPSGRNLFKKINVWQSEFPLNQIPFEYLKSAWSTNDQSMGGRWPPVATHTPCQFSAQQNNFTCSHSHSITHFSPLSCK